MRTRSHLFTGRGIGLLLGVLVSLFSVGPPLLADDIEVYIQPPSDAVNPNVLFILDESGSMGSKDGTNSTRMSKLHDAMNTLLNSQEITGVNVALLGFTTDVKRNMTRVVCGIQQEEYVCGQVPEEQCTETCTPVCDGPPVCSYPCDQTCSYPCDQVCDYSCSRTCVTKKPSDWKQWNEREKVRICVGDCEPNKPPNKACSKRWRKQGHDCHYEKQYCGYPCDKDDCSYPCDQVCSYPCDQECTPSCHDECQTTCQTVMVDVMCTRDVDVCTTETVYVNGNPTGDRDYFGMVHADFVGVTDRTRQALVDTANSLTPIGWTPTVRALRDGVAWFENSLTDTPLGATYQSPIQLWCQPNHIVLLSDGQPNTNDTSQGGLSSYRGQTCASDWTSRYQNGRCAREISAWAYNTDLRTGPDWDGKQNVVTHTISFYADTKAQAFLESISNNGGGGFYTASSAADLLNAFQSILSEAKATISYSYTTPTIPMDASNSVVSGDKIYVPVFQPATNKFWKGNLKKYAFVTDANNNIVLKGYGDTDVVDADYRFLDTARDLWSDVVDGADPLLGGAASQLTGPRNLYTYHQTSSSKILTASDNRVQTSNSEITAAMLGVSNSTERQQILDWISVGQGEMGAPLHTKPRVVTYGNGDRIVLLPTTDGTLHAFDSESGSELWAYIPEELLPNLQTIKENPTSINAPLYGLDSPGLLIHRDDGAGTATNANNGRVDPGEKAYYVFGMRRGGENYYALDVSNRTVPKFLWKIEGGTGDFQKLGQTWSEPQMGRIKVGGTETDVLIFGGGYDVSQDSVTGARTADTVGNAIYIVDADTGQRLTWISNSGANLNISEMTNSIPAPVTVIDVDADGLSDRIYAADVGGRILRIDLGDTLTGGVIADLNGGQDASDNRRFFYAPDVAYVSLGGKRYLAIVIGSGFIPNPADPTVQDRFYMIRDYDVFAPPKDQNENIVYTTLTESDLYDATSNLIQTVKNAADEAARLAEEAAQNGDPDAQQLAEAAQQAAEDLQAARAALDAKQGWYIDLSSREKTFSKAGVYDYVVLFSTYTVNSTTGGTAPTDACQVNTTDGNGSIYAVNLLDATALFAGMDGDANVLDTNDRSRTLKTPGLPPEPVVLYPGTDAGLAGGIVVAIGGLEKIVTWPDRFRALYWEEVPE